MYHRCYRVHTMLQNQCLEEAIEYRFLQNSILQNPHLKETKVIISMYLKQLYTIPLSIGLDLIESAPVRIIKALICILLEVHRFILWTVPIFTSVQCLLGNPTLQNTAFYRTRSYRRNQGNYNQMLEAALYDSTFYGTRSYRINTCKTHQKALNRILLK